MKRLAPLLLLMMLTLALTACATEEPAVEEPAVEEPAAEEPAVEEPAVEEPAVDEPAVEEPAVEEPAVEEPAAEEPAAEEPAAEEPITYAIVPEESRAFYTVDEQFLRDGIVDFTAVGVTQEISGTVLFDPANPQASMVNPITIDISAFESDDERRDNAIRDNWLESATFPLATFVPTEITGLPESYAFGDEVTLQMMGDLTIRETTQPTTFEVTGTISETEMTGTATTTFLMTDFGFDPPDILNVLRAENEVLATLEFVARPQE